MTGDPAAGAADAADGRTARRDRNRIAVLDAVLALFAEDDLDPSPDQVARRSGVSLRSVYRYVADRDDLARAAIQRHLETVGPRFEVDDLGRGPLDGRIARFVATRVGLFETIGATARAARRRAPDSAIIRDQLDEGRRLLREQLEAHFAPELDPLPASVRRAVVAAADALTQIETIDFFRRARGFSPAQTSEALTIALRALLIRKY